MDIISSTSKKQVGSDTDTPDILPQATDIADFLADIRRKPYLHLASIEPDKAIEGKKFRSIPEAVKWAKSQNKKGAGVYFTVNAVVPSFNGPKPSKTDIGRANLCHIDIDPDLSGGVDYAQAREHLLTVTVPALMDSPIPPTWVNDSGNGIQAFWALNVTTPPQQRAATHQAVENANKRLIETFDGDQGTGNIDRLMRVPFGLNYPNKTKLGRGYPAEPTEPRILRRTGRTYELHEITEATLTPSPVTSSDPENAPIPGCTDPEGVKAQLRAKASTDTILSERWDGSTEGLKDVSKSARDMSMMAILKARGFTLAESAYLLSTWAHGNGPEHYGNDHRYFRRLWVNSSVRTVEETLAAIALVAGPWQVALGNLNAPDAVVNDVLIEMAKEHGGINAVKKVWKAHAAERQQEAEARQVEATLAERSPLIWDETQPRQMLIKAEQILIDRAPNTLFWFGTVLVHVRKQQPIGAHQIDSDQPAPETILLADMTPLSLNRVVNDVAVVLKPKVVKGVVMNSPTATPTALLAMLKETRGSDETIFPHVNGIVPTPVVTPSGDLIATPGYDERTRLYLDFDTFNTDDLPTASAGYEILRKEMFGEFPFETEVDAAAAVGLFMTTLSRKLMDQAPAFMSNAKTQSSGKTTLIRMVHLVATGCDLGVHTWCEDQDEFRKAMLSTLLQSPSVVCWDNLDDGQVVESGVLSAVLTGTSLKQRLLGGNQDAIVPTNCVFAVTGNNLTTVKDLVSRFIEIRIDPQVENPEERVFKHPDVMEYCLANRERWIRCALAILMGELAESPKGDRFTLWSEMVRLPLLKASGLDILDQAKRTAEDSPDQQKLAAFHKAIDLAYGSDEFTATGFFTRYIEPMSVGIKSRPSNHDGDNPPAHLESKSEDESYPGYYLADHTPERGWTSRSFSMALGKIKGRVLAAKRVDSRTKDGVKLYRLKSQ